MAPAESSEYLPLQAYHSEPSSVSTTQAIIQPPRRTNLRRLRPSEDHELGFLRVVGRNNVPIIPFANIRLASPEWQTDMETRSGLTMQVHRGTWGTQSVALKRIKKYMFDKNDVDSQADAMRNYRQAMLDQGFELQIMSKDSLQRHRNIVSLLAVTFDPAWTSDADPTGTLVLPILVTEHADSRFPDLSLFLNPRHNPTLPKQLSFETAASLIADIADGVTALHAHDIVHADLKPANILIFPNSAVPCGFVAKVADFGLSGMTTYRNDGFRFSRRGPPRGGSAEWNAPECIVESTPTYVNEPSKEEPFELPSRDIYSFGLLASYIALDGQTPGHYIQDLTKVKLSDGMINVVRARLESYFQGFMADPGTLGSLVSKIVGMTLDANHEKRIKGLGDIRVLLFGCNPFKHEHPIPTKFVLNFNIFPDSLHQFKCEGFYRAYWQSPPAFRERVHKSFLKVSSGKFPQYITPDIMRFLEEPDSNDPVNNASMPMELVNLNSKNYDLYPYTRMPTSSIDLSKYNNA